MVAELRERNWPASERPILGRLEMAVRLLRWLQPPTPASAEFEDLAHRYASRRQLGGLGPNTHPGGLRAGPLASALARLSTAVKERRERLNLQFAAALAAWNNQGAHFRTLTGVESVVERYVLPFAQKDEPVLVVVLDGMSYAVCRELAGTSFAAGSSVARLTRFRPPSPRCLRHRVFALLATHFRQLGARYPGRGRDRLVNIRVRRPT